MNAHTYSTQHHTHTVVIAVALIVYSHQISQNRFYNAKKREISINNIRITGWLSVGDRHTKCENIIDRGCRHLPHKYLIDQPSCLSSAHKTSIYKKHIVGKLHASNVRANEWNREKKIINVLIMTFLMYTSFKYITYKWGLKIAQNYINKRRNNNKNNHANNIINDGDEWTIAKIALKAHTSAYCKSWSINIH